VGDAAEVAPAASRYVWIQTRECEDSLDPGSIIEGKYHIAAEGEVIVTDMDGNFLAGQMPFPGQDAAQLARTLLRGVESSGTSDFNRPIRRQSWGIA
jgi:hypothetical protein